MAIKLADLTTGASALLLFLLSSFDLCAQGGSAGAALRGIVDPSEAALGGVVDPGSRSASALFNYSAALGQLDGPSVSFAWSFLNLPQSSFQTSIAAPIGSFAGIGIGVAGYNVRDIAFRDRDERPIGTGSSSDLIIAAGGSLAIGPAAVGLGVRYLRYDLHEFDGSSWGLTLDLSGTISFRERVTLGFALTSLAGSMNASYRDGLHEDIPGELRLSGSYVYPLTRNSRTVREDPLGRTRQEELDPPTYIKGIAEVRISDYEDDAILGIGIESVPFRIDAETGIGLRVGVNSRTDLSFGTFIDLPLGLGRNPRLSFSARNDHDRSGLTMHAGLELSL
jgi:hypothetical protein